MDKQQIFNTVYLHYMTGGEFSHVSGYCMLRSPSGNRCAIGLLMTDEEYSRNIEGMSVQHEVFLGFRNRLGCENDLDVAFLNRLMKAHDSAVYGTCHGLQVAVFSGIMENIADEYGLEIPNPQEYVMPVKVSQEVLA